MNRLSTIVKKECYLAKINLKDEIEFVNLKRI